MSAVIYPGSTDPAVTYSNGSATIDGTDHVSYAYDIQGEVASMTDQNGTTHGYGYDNLGREISDTVENFGAGVSQSVNEIAYGYSVQGNLSTVTSYAASGNNPAGTVVNEDYMTYNDAGLLANDYQNPSGAISINASTGQVTDGTPFVGYNYDPTHGNRLTSMEYPNGREISYNYTDSGADAALNRVGSITDASSTGPTLGQLPVPRPRHGGQREVPEPQVELDLTGGNDAYSGLDQYGRVIDQLWHNYGTAGTGTLDEYRYGYDSQGDVLWKQNVTADNAGLKFDESYTYDHLGQLTAAYSGQLESDGNGGEKMPANTPASYSANLNGLGSIYNNPRQPARVRLRLRQQRRSDE